MKFKKRKHVNASKALLLVTRTLLGAPGLTTSNKKGTVSPSKPHSANMSQNVRIMPLPRLFWCEWLQIKRSEMTSILVKCRHPSSPFDPLSIFRSDSDFSDGQPLRTSFGNTFFSKIALVRDILSVRLRTLYQCNVLRKELEHWGKLSFLGTSSCLRDMNMRECTGDE